MKKESIIVFLEMEIKGQKTIKFFKSFGKNDVPVMVGSKTQAKVLKENEVEPVRGKVFKWAIKKFENATIIEVGADLK